MSKPQPNLIVSPEEMIYRVEHNSEEIMAWSPFPDLEITTYLEHKLAFWKSLRKYLNDLPSKEIKAGYKAYNYLGTIPPLRNVQLILDRTLPNYTMILQ